MAGGDDKTRIERSRQGARARVARADKDTRRGGELAGIVSASPIPPFASGFTVNDCGHLTPFPHPSFLHHGSAPAGPRHCLSPNFFGYCPSIGQISRMIRVADKILPRFRARYWPRSLSASQLAQPLFGTRCRSSAACFGTFDHSSPWPSDSNERLRHLFLCPNPWFPA